MMIYHLRGKLGGKNWCILYCRLTHSRGNTICTTYIAMIAMYWNPYALISISDTYKYAATLTVSTLSTDQTMPPMR